MSEFTNLASNIKGLLPAEITDFLRESGEIAQRHGQKLYLVGGAVRNILLERTNLDIDLVVDSHAIELAYELADTKQCKLITHPRFGTAKLQWLDRNIDLATARAETYARPGALPTVKPGTIKDDLSRRDFTINAMAIELDPDNFGDLLDPYQGRNALNQQLIRVLHEKSFVDDATRIWRALRYEQRLDFHLESSTQELLKHDISMLDTISGDRIRNELELILKEELPEKALRRADGLGVLSRLHPSLKGDSWLAETFILAREHSQPEVPTPQLYLALLAYRLTSDEIGQLITYLNLPKSSSRTLLETADIRCGIDELSVPGLSPSYIYGKLHGYDLTALTANYIAVDSATAAEHIELYLSVFRHIHTVLSGEDLKKQGIPEGPRIKEILQIIREAKLDGKVESRQDEEEMLRGILRAG